MIFALLLNLSFFAHAGTTCPDLNLKETELDCPWADVARELQSASLQGKNLPDVLSMADPRYFSDIEHDAAEWDMKALWGTSMNWDEYMRARIVQPEVYAALTSVFRVAPARDYQNPSDQILVHAGLEHTYGYLLSNLQTSFGYKRARWVKDDLEFGLGLSRGVLGPRPTSGTLFRNITYLLAKIAFREESKAQRLSGWDWLVRVHPDVYFFNFSDLSVQRLSETIRLSDERTVVLRTDFVRFPNADEKHSNTYLLVYSILDSAVPGGARLISGFPVDTKFVQQALDPRQLGQHQLIKTRYNGFVEGVTNSPVPLYGERVSQ